jgi:membrane protein implicated in regulation of membrane protease activity
MFLLVALVLLLLLPSPWNLIGFGAGLVLFIGEVLFWNRTVRHRSAGTGIQTLVGKPATVVAQCRPHGQVRVSGEIWAARCDDGVDVGEPVVVTSVEGLTLVVARQA